MDSFINILNNSKCLAGLAILLTNIGGRYLNLELSKKEDKFLQQPYIRRLVIFCIAFMATHDVLVSLIITLIFIIVVKRNKLFDDPEDENTKEVEK